MLSSYPPIEKGQDREKHPDNWLAYGFIAIYIILNLLYAFNETATWDDDCPTRYYNTLKALDDPGQFIDTWNRPLFVLVFFLPVHLGKYAIAIGMVIITALSGLFLYKGVRKLKVPNPWLILPLFFFQTFFFSISRNAETEPLAVSLICFGFYFLVQRKWTAFAIVGSLLPLARLELSVLLIFWVYELFRERQFKLLPVLIVPVVLWNIAGGIIEGNYLYVLKATILGENTGNRYDHTSFGHYFRRYIYVTGPIVYTLFIMGLIAKIRRRSMDGFVLLQFIAGFLLYVVFSWKLNIGNPAGFLRNLIPLAPLTALLSLEGYNFILNAIMPGSKKEGDSFRFSDDRVLIIISLFVVAVLALFFQSSILKFHHALSTQLNYLNLILILALSAFFMILYFAVQKMAVKGMILRTAGLSIALGMAIFTLISEPPDANNNPERVAVKEISDLYTQSYLKEFPTYVNHVWFFWINDLDRIDPKYREVTVSNLLSAGIGSICIYENHYSSRLAGDVKPHYFYMDKSWIEITRRMSSSPAFSCILYQKVDTSDLGSIQVMFDRFLKLFPQDNYAVVARGNYKNFFLKDPEAAVLDFEQALSADRDFFMAYYSRGMAYYFMNKPDLALNDLNQSVKLNSNYAEAYYSKGMIYNRLSKYDLAVANFSKAIVMGIVFPDVFLGRGFASQQLAKYKPAIEDYSRVLLIDSRNIDALERRSSLFYQLQKWDLSLADLNVLVEQQPQKGIYWYNKGFCEHNLKYDQEACVSWNKALQSGVPKAAELLEKYCR